MNKVNLLGRMVKEPEMRYTPSGTAVVSFTVAVDKRFQKQGEERQADFINIVAWNKTAEFVANYFTKGQMIALSGSIQTRTWEDNEGKKRYATEVVADEVYFAGEKKSGEIKPMPTGMQQIANNASEAGFTEVITDDGLPF